jgi:hypothetical protein
MSTTALSFTHLTGLIPTLTADPLRTETVRELLEGAYGTSGAGVEGTVDIVNNTG